MASSSPSLASSGPSLSSIILSMVITATPVRTTPPILRSSSDWLIVWTCLEDSSCSLSLCARRLCGPRWCRWTRGRRRWWERSQKYSPPQPKIHIHSSVFTLSVLFVILCVLIVIHCVHCQHNIWFITELLPFLLSFPLISSCYTMMVFPQGLLNFWIVVQGTV